MFSGKTTELMRRLKRYQIAKHNCLIIKYAKDVRYDSDGIATHDKQVLPAVAATALDELRGKTDDYSVIGIDEGQFFPDTVEFAEEMANRGKIVIVAALDGTYQRLGFGNILQLVPLAESIVKLTAVCMICYEEASYTKRTSTETAHKISGSVLQVEVIGGSEMYIATCRKCFFIPTPQKRPGVSPLKPVQENMETTESSSTCKRRLMDGKEGTGTLLSDKENCSMQMA
ncbi:thymidine kinase, cytosolic-like [Penaeus japonicus]|uniref:thymidine kinase, cytosolic-like n=1 Tax=Penaeus japonicus TaxID=27405 RepID=UPI001C70BAC8|nr:thymidine kinase, cytosolic-like [Penaeus japonicus]